MSFIRRILSHGFLILLILGAALVYYYRAEIFSGAGKQQENAAALEHDSAAEAVVTVQSTSDLAEKEANKNVKTDAQETTETGDKELASSQNYFGGGKQTNSSTVQEPTVDLSKYRPLTPEQEPASDEQQSTVDDNTAIGNQTGNLADTGITAKSEQAVADEQVPGSETQASAPVLQAPTPALSGMPQQYPGQQGGMPRDMPQTMATAPHFPPPSPPMEEPEATQEELQLITSARQAFWERDIEQAEKHYKALSALQADNPDPFGELGNVYYSAGQWDKAADAYYQAGERLIQRGQYRRTMHLVTVLRGLNTERATALNNLLNDALPKAVSQPENKTIEPAEITSK